MNRACLVIYIEQSKLIAQPLMRTLEALAKRMIDWECSFRSFMAAISVSIAKQKIIDRDITTFSFLFLPVLIASQPGRGDSRQNLVRSNDSTPLLASKQDRVLFSPFAVAL